MPDHGGYVSLWDWRRRVSAMYAAARQAGGGEAAWLAWRAARDALFRDHPQSPLVSGRSSGLPFHRYDPALRFAVPLREVTGESIPLPVGEDGAVTLQPFAVTEGLAPALGRELTVYWIAVYGGGAFLPFADATSGRESYGGGRYLLDTIKGADLGTDAEGRTVLDFNYAYNPSCSYSDRYICPLAPSGNRLSGAVRGGEMREAASA